jgi:hypothetical protein
LSCFGKVLCAEDFDTNEHKEAVINFGQRPEPKRGQPKCCQKMSAMVRHGEKVVNAFQQDCWVHLSMAEKNSDH